MAHAGTKSKHPLTDLLALTAIGQACRFPFMSSLREITAALMIFAGHHWQEGIKVLLNAMFLLSKNCGFPYIEISVLEQTNLVSPYACEGSLFIYSRILKF